MEKHIAGFTLRKNGASFTEISQLLVVTQNTVTKWSRKYNWQSRLDDQQEFQESSLENVRSLISHNLKVLNAIKDRMIDDHEIETASIEELKKMLTDKGDVDSLNKLFVNIRGKEITWDQIVRNTDDFIKYLELENNALAKKVSEYAMTFLEEKRQLA